MQNLGEWVQLQKLQGAILHPPSLGLGIDFQFNHDNENGLDSGGWVDCRKLSGDVGSGRTFAGLVGLQNW